MQINAFIPQVVVLNLIFDCINTGATLWTGKSNQLGVMQYSGLALFAAGSFVETFSEMQRAHFKKDPHNAGKLHMGGLFALSQHINYLGYQVRVFCFGFFVFCFLFFFVFFLIVVFLLLLLLLTYLHTHYHSYGDQA